MSPETYRAELKRLINEKVVASCWLFTSVRYLDADKRVDVLSSLKYFLLRSVERLKAFLCFLYNVSFCNHFSAHM